MAGIIKKTEQTLGMGGPKEGDKQSGEHKPEQKGEHNAACRGEHKPEQKGEHKPACQGDEQQKEGGGFMDKVKGKIPGVGGQEEKGEEKKKDHLG